MLCFMLHLNCYVESYIFNVAAYFHAKCHIFIVKLSVVTQNATIVGVVMMNGIMLSITLLLSSSVLLRKMPL